MYGKQSRYPRSLELVDTENKEYKKTACNVDTILRLTALLAVNDHRADRLTFLEKPVCYHFVAGDTVPLYKVKWQEWAALSLNWIGPFFWKPTIAMRRC